ncbi:MAG: nicotinate (nicotinamide) nucleotide adenylyltransferase [Gammaproteobacteria bacterium]|nr:nicotinate (nicotinamide) nucleotide adenylyltransferase [Gammaproteobacteria bacterium]
MILLGGTFDPVHCGHLQAARIAGAQLACAIHLLIAPRPQLRPRCAASYADRWAMLQLACQSDSALIPFDFEQGISGPTHTVVTLERLRQTTTENFVWILGSDALMKVRLWHRAEELPDWLSFFVFRRPGIPTVELPRHFRKTNDARELLQRQGLIYISTRPMLDLSGSKIRHLRKNGKEIKSLVTAPVHDYIISKHLYEPKDSC